MAARRRARRVLRVLAYALGVAAVLLLGAAVFVRIKFPPERIRVLALQKAGDMLNGRQVTCGKVRVRPFRGFVIKQVAVADSASGQGLATVEEVALDYRLLSLLRKRLEISRIWVNEPMLHVVVDREGRTSLDDLIAAPRDTTGSAREEAPFSGLAFTLVLDRLEVCNISARVEVEGDTTWTTAGIEGLQLTLFDLRLKTLGDLGGGLKLGTEAGRWYYAKRGPPNQRVDMGAELALRVDVPEIGLQQVAVQADMGLSSVHASLGDSRYELPEEVWITCAARVSPSEGLIGVEQARVSIGEWLFLSGTANIAGVGDGLNVEARLDSLSVNLGQLAQRAESAGLLRLHPKLSEMELDGALWARNLSVKGLPGGPMELAGALGVEVGRVALPGQGPRAEEASARVQVNSKVADDGQQRTIIVAEVRVERASHPLAGGCLAEAGDLSVRAVAQALLDPLEAPVPERANVRVGAAQLAYVSPGTLPIEAKDVLVEMRSAFAGGPLPEEVTGELAIGRLLDGQISGLFTAGLDPSAGGPPIPAKLSVELTATGLKADTWTDSALTGRFDLSLVLGAEGLGDVRMGLEARSPDAAYLWNGAYESLPADLGLEAHVGLIQDLSDVTIHHFDLRAMDMLRAEGSGAILKGGKEKLTLALDHLVVDNARVVERIPAGAVGGDALSASGTTSLSGKLEAKLLQGSGLADYRAEGELRLEHTGLAWPDKLLRVSGLNGTIKVEAREDSVAASAIVLVDSLQKDDLLEEPVAGSKVAFSSGLYRPSGGERLSDWEGQFDLWADVQSLKTSIKTAGQLKRALSTHEVSAHTTVSFSCPDTVRLPGKTWALGSMDADIHSRLGSDSLAHLSGTVTMDSLFMGAGSKAAVENIVGKLAFRQGLDLGQKTLAGVALGEPGADLGMRDVSYDLWRPYHARESRVHIGRIVGAGYEASNLEADIRLRDGVLNVPQFVLDAYQGNAAGRLRVDLGTGAADQIRYQVKAQMSGINSAQLPGVQRKGQEASQLCGNLEFWGRGIDPAAGFEIDGSLHITKIERWVADNLLMLMDPKGTDKSIQNVRRLLGQGWGVRSFSFMTKGGFIYPSIVPVKPWFAPFSLPKTLGFPRMPLRFFLQYLSPEQAGGPT